MRRRRISERYKDCTGVINTTNEKIRDLNLKISEIEFKDKYVDSIYERKRTNIVLWIISPLVLYLLFYIIVNIFPDIILGREKKLYIFIAVMLVIITAFAFGAYKLFNLFQKNKKIKKHSDYRNRIDIIEKDREKLTFKLSEYEIDNEKHKYYIDEEKKIDGKIEEIERKYKTYNLIIAQ